MNQLLTDEDEKLLLMNQRWAEGGHLSLNETDLIKFIYKLTVEIERLHKVIQAIAKEPGEGNRRRLVVGPTTEMRKVKEGK